MWMRREVLYNAGSYCVSLQVWRTKANVMQQTMKQRPMKSDLRSGMKVPRWQRDVIATSPVTRSTSPSNATVPFCKHKYTQ